MGTPKEILLNPVDAYVSSFFRNVDVSKVLRASDIVELQRAIVWEAVDGASAIAPLRELDERHARFGYLVDVERRFQAVIARDGLARHDEINRRPGRDEMARAFDAARRAGLWRFDRCRAG